MSTIDDIKSRIDIVDLISETVQLRRSGKNYTGFCPFHSNTRTPAFAVFADSGTWRCFGQCNEGGDIFKFVMKRDGVDFVEALRLLAEKAGVQLKPPSPEEQAAVEENDHLRALLEESVNFYRHQLFNTAAGKIALDYLRQKRALRDETVEAFGLGYAPDAWGALLQHFRGRGYSEQDLLDAGLLSVREAENNSQRSGMYDRFRNRIMFPIRDERGRMAGFGARILNPDDVPKFLNSPQTAIFDKGRLLYGLDRARKAIRTQDQAVIVEGYLDVISLHQAGYTNAISPMGTALTGQQFYLLKRYTRRIILALDPDAAGDQATLRGLQVARESMDHENDPVFDARGLLGHEARLQADIRVTTLPTGLDPDELVTRDPKEWEQIVEDARPVVVHVMETLAAGRDLDDAKIKSDIAARVLPLIEDIPNPVERDAYRQRLARLLRISELTMLELVPSSRSRSGPRRSSGASIAGKSTDEQHAPRPSRSETASTVIASSYGQEAHCLGVLLRRPDLLYQVDRRLQDEQLSRLSLQDFQHVDHQAIMRLLQEAVDQDLAEPRDFVLYNLSLPMMDLADGLLARTEKLDPNDDRVLEDLMRGLLDLRRRSLHQDLEYQQYLIQEAQQQGDATASQYLHSMVQLMEVKRRLDRAVQRYTSRSLAARLPG